jgi:hypothetical protein
MWGSGTKVSADRGGIAAGRDIIGIPPEQLPGIIAAAKHGEQKLDEILALLKSDPRIAAARDEHHVPLAVVNRFFEQVGLGQVEPEAVPGAFDSFARRYAEQRGALERGSNEDPEIAGLRTRARAALETGDLDTSDRLLAEMRARHRALVARRRSAASEARSDLLAALEDEADTCARQADGALLRLDAKAAAGFYRDGLDALAEMPEARRWEYAVMAAYALQEFGDRAGNNDALIAAIDLYERALGHAPRERVPRHWAMTQNNLGGALGRLGERESGTARLEEAVAAYLAALQEQTRERVPLDWATTQSNLGAALGRLGERESGTARLEEAVAAYRAALEERTRERMPLDWARTQNNLGAALRTLGERESGTARLEEAVAAYLAALQEQTRERVPLDWATTQNNLGNALLRLGERESGTAHLEEAVAAYLAALQEQTRERVPLDWAMTQNNLGTALETLGERESGTAHLEEAVAAYDAALAVFIGAKAEYYVETARANRERASRLIVQRRGSGK